MAQRRPNIVALPQWSPATVLAEVVAVADAALAAAVVPIGRAGATSCTGDGGDSSSD
eukprot:CAMPEP_0179319528 /NCGR_PEP_ID=MMETSP0797-20121207/57531_1 /TAXON_ID=47934 /ORGANISM="Dinophysis acuminata, Strain DAEP01" /LENGTH=56 /DNA_ID=CAMNT_0021030901 /DNA_START=84 /DNA_END=251 /DNA_ORIENTATION=-